MKKYFTILITLLSLIAHADITGSVEILNPVINSEGGISGTAGTNNMAGLDEGAPVTIDKDSLPADFELPLGTKCLKITNVSYVSANVLIPPFGEFLEADDCEEEEEKEEENFEREGISLQPF